MEVSNNEGDPLKQSKTIGCNTNMFKFWRGDTHMDTLNFGNPNWVQSWRLNSPLSNMPGAHTPQHPRNMLRFLGQASARSRLLRPGSANIIQC